LDECPITQNRLRSEVESSRLFNLVDCQTDGIVYYSRSVGTQSFMDSLFAFSPAIIIFVATMIVSFYAGTAEGLFLIQSRIRTLVRFVVITTILLLPLPILPRLITFVGKKLRDEGPLGRLVKDEMGRSVQFSKYLLWVIRPLQGVGMSMIFSNQLLNLFRTYPEASFLGALIRPVLFIAISVPISILFSTIWTLDDLGIKLYQKKTREVRLVGSYFGTILPVVSGALGIYSLFQRSPPMDALIMVILIVIVLYPPYLMFAIIHHKFLGERKGNLFDSLPFSCVELQIRSHMFIPHWQSEPIK
jgi:hypothetical protein